MGGEATAMKTGHLLFGFDCSQELACLARENKKKRTNEVHRVCVDFTIIAL
jgi:hypothetical protein